MKRSVATTCLTLVLLVLPGCSDSWDTQVRIAELESHVAQLEQQLEGYREREARRSGEVSDSQEPSPEEGEEDVVPEASPPQEGEVGSRKYPVPLGRPFTFDHAHIRGDMNVSIQVTEVLRGERAVTHLAGGQGRVPEGKELMLIRTRFALNRFTPDEAFLCSQTSFTFYEWGSTQITDYAVVTNIEDLYARLFEGGETEGWLYTAVDPADPTPHAVFDNTVWFALYSDPTLEEETVSPAQSEAETAQPEPGPEQPQPDGQPETESQAPPQEDETAQEADNDLEPPLPGEET